MLAFLSASITGTQTDFMTQCVDTDIDPNTDIHTHRLTQQRPSQRAVDPALRLSKTDTLVIAIAAAASASASILSHRITISIPTITTTVSITHQDSIIDENE